MKILSSLFSLALASDSPSLEPQAEFSYKVSCEIFCNGEISDEMTGMASVSRTDGSFTNDYYFGIGGVKGYSQLFFWMENPNYPANASFGWELLSSVGSQWWMESRNPTYVFPCEAGSWNDVELVQRFSEATNMWTKTLTVNGEDRYRITSNEPNRGVLTGHSTIIGRTERSDQMRNLKIEQVEFTPLLGVAQNAYEAELRCRKLGGHLAFFRNALDWQDYLATVGDFAAENWIGAQRVGTSNRFVNNDGTEAFLPWSDGEPNNANAGDENCVEAWRNGDGVNDQNCYSGGRQYSCRIDRPPTCADIEPNCGSNCSSGFSELFCPLTCGTCDTWAPQTIGDISFLDNWNDDNCKDLNDQCESWANSNQCMVNPNYMLRNCPVSCKQCTPVCVGFESLPVNIKASWRDAKKICKFAGGLLPYFSNEEEFEAFTQNREGRNDWLGIERSGNKFKAHTLKNKQKLTFTNWNAGEPTNSGGEEDCVEALPSHKWNDKHCSFQLSVTCRFEHERYC